MVCESWTRTIGQGFALASFERMWFRSRVPGAVRALCGEECWAWKRPVPYVWCGVMWGATQVSFVFLIQLILVNLVVAVILESYSEASDSQRRLVSSQVLRNYVDQWKVRPLSRHLAFKRSGLGEACQADRAVKRRCPRPMSW